MKIPKDLKKKYATTYAVSDNVHAKPGKISQVLLSYILYFPICLSVLWEIIE
jgi:hypothetical protein